MACVEHLLYWREYVGYKSKNMNDKRHTSTYKVRKDRRLKSFMEIITAKQKKKVDQMSKQHGITIHYRKAGEMISSDEEKDFRKVNDLIVEKALKKRERKKS
jgi:hypothetical protein